MSAGDCGAMDYSAFKEEREEHGGDNGPVGKRFNSHSGNAI